MSYGCPTCGKELGTKSGLGTHHSIVHNESLDLRETIVCEQCGNNFKVKPSHSEDRRFCSMKCTSEWRSENLSGKDHPNWKQTRVSCDECGDNFYKRPKRIERSNKHFCSEKCKEKYWGNNYSNEIGNRGNSVETECKNCKDSITVPKNRYDKFDKNFCTQTCYGEWLSENNTGKSHPKWKKNREDIDYGVGWDKIRTGILKRDGECQLCGMGIEEHIEKYDQRPDVHHKIPIERFNIPENANNPENLIVLCRQCHRITETDVIASTVTNI